MGNEAFYATTAQVLPALLIAFAVEVGLLVRDPLKDVDRDVEDAMTQVRRIWPDDQALLKRLEGQMRRAYVENARRLVKVVSWMGALLGVAVALGEVLAVVALYQDGNDHLRALAGPACVFAMVFGVYGVAALPAYRISGEARRLF